MVDCARWCCRLLVVTALLACAAPSLCAQSADALLPIQRILIKPERAAKEMDKVQAGGLVLWPLEQFETRLDRARKLLQARELVPALTRASYSAELVGRALTNGRGQWAVQHAGAGLALLPIEPLNLAMHQLTWEQGGDAVLAEFDGKSLGLLVKHTGTQICYFDWSARGTPANDGIAFTLTVPACALTTFEFKLPADRWLFAPKNLALVTGPHEDDSPNHRLWRLQATGQTAIDVVIRQVTNPKGPAATMFARVQSTQTLTPDRIALEHDFQIDVLHGSVQELTLETDDELQPFDVALKGSEIKTWHWKENVEKKDAKGKLLLGSVGVLTIEFQQPVQGRIQGLRVKSLAPRPSSTAWTSPALHVRNAQGRGETLQLHLLANVQASQWDPGTFQILDIKTEDGTQILTLADTAASPATSRRPSLTLDRQTPDVHTTERCDWHITPRDAVLHAEIDYAVTRGRLFELIVQLPKTLPSYQIDTLELQPAEMFKSWHPAGGLLIVELKQALVPGKKATLKIQMRAGARPLPGVARILSYPELEPKSVGKREGTAAIRVDPMLHAQLLGSSLPPAPYDPAVRANRQAAPSFLFAFRNQRLSASIRVIPESVQLDWRGKHRLTLTEETARLRFRWDIEPVAGAPEYFDLRFAPNFPSNWKVLSGDGDVRVHHWERLPVEEALPHLLRFGASNGLHATVLAGALPVGSRWRFHLTEPLRKKTTFRIEAMVPAGMIEDDWRRVSLGLPSANPWEVVGGALAREVLPRSPGVKIWALPLAAPLDRWRADDDIVVDSPFEPIQRAAVAGSRSFVLPGKAAGVEVLAPASDKSRHEATFKISLSRARPELTLWTRPDKRTASPLQRCDEAALATYLYQDGRRFQRIEFQLWHWRERTCELRLPPGYQIVAARIQRQALERLDIKEDIAGIRLVLPIDQSGDSVHCEILARAPAQGGFLFGMTSVEVPVIEWPAPPMTLRSRIFLEDGVVPLDQESFAPIGVPLPLAHQSATLRGVRQLWTWGKAWLPFANSTSLQERLETQKQTVLAREQEMRAAGLKALKLSHALERLALDHLKDRTPLIVDAVAFHDLGLTLDTLVPSSALNPQASKPFWEALGLTYLPCPSGALLTSTRRLQQLGIHELSDIARLDGALEEATLHGQDASAGFHLILSWLKAPAEALPFGDDFDSRIGARRNLTEWVALAGPSSRFIVVDATQARYLGWMLAVLAALALWSMQRTLETFSCFRGHLLIMTASVLLLVWLPINVRELLAWPAFLMEVIASLLGLARLLLARAPSGIGGQSTRSIPGTVMAGLLLVSLFAMCSALAQPPAVRSYSVLIIDGAKPAAILTPDLIAKLDELDNLPPVGTQNAVLVSAKYVGKVNDAVARFDAQYDIQSFKDQTNLLLPLTGVQLHEGVFLDGTPVFPSVQKNGYAIPIRAKGSHRLRFSFSVRVTSSADHAELKFTIPKLIQNEVSLQWPVPVQTVDVVHGWGAEERVFGKGETVKELRAQLGHEGTVYLRWTGSAPAPGVKSVDVKEAHLWDLRPGSLGLVSSFQYAIGKNALTQLNVALPEALQVRAVDVLPGPQVPAAAPIIVKSWQILGQGAQRRLTVELAQPVSGQIILNLEIHPRLSLRERQLLLPLPAPLQSKSIAGLVGYRLDALELRSTAQNLSVQGISAAEFEQLWKKQTLRASPTSPARAYNFQRKGVQAGLELATQSETRQARFQLDWTVDLHHADLRGKFTIASSFEDIILLEFALDAAMTLADVVGPDVARWTITDTTLQVWLRAPRKQVTLELIGWRALPFKSNLPGKTLFVLPTIHPLDAQTLAASVQIHPVPGIHIDVEKPRRLRPSAAEPLLFQIEDAAYGATFWLRPETRAPAAALLTKIHAGEDGLELRHGIRITTERGTLPTLTLHVRNKAGTALIVDAPGASVQQLKNPDHAAWTIKYPPGQPQEVFITLRDQAAIDKLASLVLPTVELENVPFRSNWVAWKDVELLDADTGKKLPHRPFIKEQVVILRDEGRFGDQPGWNYSDRPRSLQAVLPKTTARTNARILSAAEEIFVDDRLKWSHTLTLRIHAPEAMELRIRFPAEIEQLSAFSEHQLMQTRSLTPSLTALPVDAGNRPQEIRLRWTYAASAQRIDKPNLGAVQIEPAVLPAHARRLWVPQWLRTRADPMPSPTLLGGLLDQAEAHAQRAAALAQDAPAQEDASAWIQLSQHDFYASIRQADYALGVLQSSRSGFDAASWQKRLNDVAKDNAALAKKFHYERQRDAAKKAKRAPLVPVAGETTDAEGIPWLVTLVHELVPLRSAPIHESADFRTRSEWLLLSGVFLFLISYFRRGTSIVRGIAPELGVLVAFALMAWQGWSIIGLVFAIGILLFRGVLLVKHFRRVSPDLGDAGAPSQGPTIIQPKPPAA